MPTKTTLYRSLLTTLGSATALVGTGSYAQEAPNAEPQRVVVTGSNIRRVESETASPVQTVTREEIAKSGKTSVAEFLQTLAVDNQGSVPTSFSGGFASGASGISLRGLGVASTLVLLNGRRLAPYGLADDGQKVFVDLNLIPLEAVDRVEILKDGASAIYGSDAIAGVVNVILRRDFRGGVLSAAHGQSRYGDGAQTRATLSAGFGHLDVDKFNVLLNLEASKKDAIWARDRAGRAQVGRGDLRDLGFDAASGLGGTGAIVTNNVAGSSVNGNVRNPTTLDYFSRGNLAGVGFTRNFVGAACSNFTQHAQGDPGGGCLIDAAQQYGQIQPAQKTVNLFARGTVLFAADMQAYAEFNVYNSKSQASATPSGISGSVGYPGGPVSNAGVALGASHPDNPYFGSAARLRYLAADVGARHNDIDSTFTRVVAGVKGSWQGWDIDSAVLHSENKVDNERTGQLQRDVMFALLNPTAANVAAATAGSAAYAALPAGSVWRIAENAGLNSPALYAALAPALSSDARSKTEQMDFKASREVAQLPGGALGLALGAEVRRESIRLTPVTGTERGNIVGLGYSAYNGVRDVSAAYGELLAPVGKTVEISGAMRMDHYSDIGNSVTPKLGLKWTPARSLVLRATYAQGFRAPSSAENGVGGLAAFSTAADPVRCALGVPGTCNALSVAIIASPNPALTGEKSKSHTAGVVWDLAPKTSLAVDLWQIVRRDEINQELIPAAIAAGHVARDPTTATNIPGDPGAITAVLAKYVNSAQTTVRGVDLDLRQGFDLGADLGKLSLDLKWTHLFTWLRKERDGSQRDFAGTHGNCDVTNCVGTPADRVNLGATWAHGDWNWAANLNYRGALSNKLFKGDPAGCATAFADGSDAPAGCKIAAFTTVDLTGRWKLTPHLEVFGSIQNLFDKVPPLDPTTYGATSYNPLDYSGAVGRYFNTGIKYRF